MHKKRFIARRSREDGVSESIGFVIIFSLVMIGIGLVTLYGYPLLLKQQSATNVRNMERDMIILQNDVKSLAYKNIPYKETSLQVAGGALTVFGCNSPGYRANFTISVINLTDSSEYLRIEQNAAGQLRYESDSLDDVVALENGGVLRRQKFSQGSAMLAEPRWYIDNTMGNETFVINLINISSDTVRSRTGVGTVKMALKDVWYNETEEGSWKIEIEYNPDPEYDFSVAWKNYFTNTLGLTESGSLYYRDGLERVVIKRYEIAVESL